MPANPSVTSYLRCQGNNTISTWPQQLQFSHLFARNSQINLWSGTPSPHDPQIRDKFDNQLYIFAFNCKSNVASSPGHALKKQKKKTESYTTFPVETLGAAYKSLPRPPIA